MKLETFMTKEPFFFYTGKKAKSLQDFLKLLKKLEDRNFNLQVNTKKNDFAVGIRYSKKSFLANKISHLNTQMIC